MATIGSTQLYNQAGIRLVSAGARWDNGSNFFAFALASSSYTPLDAHTTISDVQLGNIITTGDGSPLLVGNRLVVENAGVTEFQADDANWGTAVTVPSVKYLLCVQKADTGSAWSTTPTLTTADRLIFWVNLDTEGGTVFSTNAPFNIQAPTSSVWFRLTAQA